MDTLKRITVLLLAAALVFAGAAALHPPQARAGINAGVVVNNLASQPVPISGNVGIDGTPTVQFAPGSMVGVNNLVGVDVKGTPTVQLAGGANVGINNFPAVQLTRDIDNPAQSPFQTQLCASTFTNADNPCGTLPSSFTVPAKQRLVIEYVFEACSAFGTGTVFDGALETTAGGNLVAHSFLFGQALSNGTSPPVNQVTRIYADPGTTVSVFAGIVAGSSGAGDCFAQLSGYLVKTP